MGFGQSFDTGGKKLRPCLLAALRRTRRSGSVRSLAAIIAKGLCLGLLAVSFIPQQVAAADIAAQNRSSSAQQFGATPLTIETQPVVAPHPKRADFGRENKSRSAQQVADWAVDSGDNHGMPFVIVDKVDARVFVFDADGRLRGAAPALLGLARGDDAAPDIGERKMSQIRPEERITPAGRFVASMGRDFYGKDMFWVDYDGAVGLHRVVTNNPKERRLERLATPTPLDNRISFGCINVPVKFFDNVVIPTLTGTYSITYVLPETRSNSQTFASFYDVDLRQGTGTTANLDHGTKSRRQQ